MKLPTVTRRLTPSGVTNGSNPSVFSRRAMMIAKHKESSPDASNARSSDRGAKVLSFSLATRSDSAHARLRQASGLHRELRETLPKLRKGPALTRKTTLARGGGRAAA